MTNQDIVSRVARLEKSNRRLRWAAVAMSVGVAAAFFLGAEARNEEITVRQIRLVDADGKLRGVWGNDRDGTFFYLNDPKGQMRTSMAAQDSGAFFNLKDDKKNTRVLLSYDDDGAVARVQDPQGLFATLVNDQRGPALQIGQENGNVRIIAPMIDILQEPQKDQKVPQK
jgi:hypothetical protein